MTGHGDAKALVGAPRREIKNVQALRGIAALMVVGAHLGGPTGFVAKQFGPTDTWTNLYEVGRTGVDLFFVVSGFIMVVTTSRVMHGAPGARRFLWRRVTRIYPPYLVVTAAIFAIYSVRPDLVNSSQDGSPGVLQSFLLLPQESPFLLLVAWTLVYEMYFYLVFTLGLLLPRRLFPYLLGLWALVTAVLNLAVSSPSNPYLALASSPLNFEFLFGAIVGWLFLTNRIVAPRTVAVLGTGAVLAVYACVLLTGGLYAQNAWAQVFTVGLLLAVITYGVIGLEQNDHLTAPPFTVNLGDWSYSLYLTHVLTLKVLGLVVAAAGLAGPAWLATSVLVAVVACIVAAGLYFRLVERPLLRVLHDRSAGRRGRPARHVATSDAP